MKKKSSRMGPPYASFTIGVICLLDSDLTQLDTCALSAMYMLILKIVLTVHNQHKNEFDHVSNTPPFIPFLTTPHTPF